MLGDTMVIRFANYYIIKSLWKIRKKRLDIADLYNRLSMNKTLYDKILRGSDDVIKKAKDRENETGLNYKYFSGENLIHVTGLMYDDWEKYFNLRQISKGAKKSTEQRDIEEKIKAAIKDDFNGANAVSAEFKAIRFYVVNLRKQQEVTIHNKIVEVLTHINEIDKNELISMQNEELERYANEVQEHIDRIRSIICLKDWNKLF